MDDSQQSTSANPPTDSSSSLGSNTQGSVNPTSNATPQETKPQVTAPENQKPEEKKQKSPNNLKKKLAVPIFVLALLTFVGTTLIYYLLSQRTNSQSARQMAVPTQFEFKASAVYLSGEAYKIVGERKDEIKEGDVLEEGDVVKTGANTKLTLALDDGTIIRLSENTKLALTKLSSNETSITEESGVLFARVEKDENHKFITYAGGLTIESLGTAFSVENDEDVTVSVYESKVLVKEEGKDDVTVDENETWDSENNKVEGIDESKLATNEFIDWSLKEEKLAKATETPTPQPTTPPTSSGTGITLSGSTADNGIYLSWTVSGVDVSKGFKIVKNLTGSPSYPGGDPMVYLDDSGARSYTWKITDGQTWHVRVCQYTGSECGVYSNEITITAPGSSSTETGSTSSISITAEKISDSKAKITWTIEGNAPKGFKVVWSKNSGPTYPCRDGDSYIYDSSPSVRTREVSGLEAGNTYHFRVCEYLGGKCGTYSNEASLSF